jgi:hypothetical protein
MVCQYQMALFIKKGHFVKVDSQTITVKDFDRNVDNYVVGFDTRDIYCKLGDKMFL